VVPPRGAAIGRGDLRFAGVGADAEVVVKAHGSSGVHAGARRQRGIKQSRAVRQRGGPGDARAEWGNTVSLEKMPCGLGRVRADI
jgi:hypothetical protein